MRRTVGRIGVIGLIMITMSGCCSYYGLQRHNARVDLAAQSVRLAATRDGYGAQISVDLLSIGTGYFAAWQADPLGMTAATAGDALTVAGIVWTADKIKNHYSSSNDSTPTTAASSTSSVNVPAGSTVTIYDVKGDGNTFNIGTPSDIGNTSTQGNTDNHTVNP